MSERPTPDQIARFDFDGTWGDSTPYPTEAGHRVQLLASLRAHGYVIVHPEDVPIESTSDWLKDYSGWNACRRHIFGGSHE